MKSASTKYERAKKAAKALGGLTCVMSSHRILISRTCKHGHSRKKYGVFNTTGHLRCRRCMTDAQIRSAKKKKERS